MTEAAKNESREGARRNLRAYYALAALIAGLIAGMFANRVAPGVREDALGVASFVGTL